MKRVPQIQYLVQGEMEHENESRDEWEARVNRTAADLNATSIQITFHQERSHADLTHDDGGGGNDIVTDIDYEYDGFNMAVIHYEVDIP